MKRFTPDVLTLRINKRRTWGGGDSETEMLLLWTDFEDPTISISVTLLLLCCLQRLK
jgi:hypothetical protein